MAQITPQLVKELREKTGAGMGDCKNALVDSDGDMQAAIEILRKKGAATAAKRADKAAKEGNIFAKTTPDFKVASIIEINCETDFVARNEQFVTYASSIADALLGSDVNTIEDLMKVNVGSDSVEDLHNEILAKFNENIQVRRFERMTSEGCFSAYIHAGNKLAVLVEVSAAEINETAQSLLRDIAMQIAAMNPQFIDRTAVDQVTVDKEIEIYRQQAIDQGKKEDIAVRIAEGRLEKFFKEQCLVEQVFVKDSDKTVNDVLKQISDEVGSEVKVLSFKRYFLGEE